MPQPGDVTMGGYDVWDSLNGGGGMRRDDEVEFGRALIRFWRIVDGECRPRDVVLQDWMGEEVVL